MRSQRKKPTKREALRVVRRLLQDIEGETVRTTKRLYEWIARYWVARKKLGARLFGQACGIVYKERGDRPAKGKGR